MRTAPANAHTTERAASRTPVAVRVSLAAVGALLLGAAVYLWVERGPALLLDLAHMGAKFLCL